MQITTKKITMMNLRMIHSQSFDNLLLKNQVNECQQIKMQRTQMEQAIQINLAILTSQSIIHILIFRVYKKDTVSSVKSNAMEYRESEVDEDLAFKYYQKKMGYAKPAVLQGNAHY